MSNNLKIIPEGFIKIDNGYCQNKYFSVTAINNNTVVASWTNTDNVYNKDYENDSQVYDAEVNLSNQAVTKLYRVSPDNQNTGNSYVLPYSTGALSLNYVVFYNKGEGDFSSNTNINANTYQFSDIFKHSDTIVHNYYISGSKLSASSFNNNQFVIVWVSGYGNHDYNSNVYAIEATIDSDGNTRTIGDVITVSDSYVALADAVSLTNIGNSVAIAWVDNQNYGFAAQVQVRTYNPTTRQLGTTITIAESNECTYADPKIGFNANTILVTWTVSCNTQTQSIYGEYFDLNLNNKGASFKISSDSEIKPSTTNIIATKDGQFAVTWQTTVNTVSNICGLNMQILNPLTLANSKAVTFLENVNCNTNAYATYKYDDKGFVVFYQTADLPSQLYVNWYRYTEIETKTTSESLNTKTESATNSANVTISGSGTNTGSESLTISKSKTETNSETITDTKSLTSTDSETISQSNTGSISATGTISATQSESASATGTLSESTTHTGSISASSSTTISDSKTISGTVSDTASIKCDKFEGKFQMYYRNIKLVSYDTSSAHPYTKQVRVYCRNNIRKEAKCTLDLRFDNPNRDRTTAFHDVLLPNSEYPVPNEYIIDNSRIFIDNDCTGREVVAEMYSKEGYIQTKQLNYDTRSDAVYSWNTTAIPRFYCISPWNTTEIGEVSKLTIGPSQCINATLSATFMKGIKVNYQADIEITGHDKFGNQMQGDELKWAVGCLVKPGIKFDLEHVGTKAVFNTTGVAIHEALSDVAVLTSGCYHPGDVNEEF